jgi:hypothetical protein
MHTLTHAQLCACTESTGGLCGCSSLSYLTAFDLLLLGPLSEQQGDRKDLPLFTVFLFNLMQPGSFHSGIPRCHPRSAWHCPGQKLGRGEWSSTTNTGA